MRFSQVALALGFATLAAAQLDAATIIEEIAPNAKSCDNSADCRTAKQAAPWIAQSMYENKIFSINQMAAIISLMAFESSDFKYKHNISPGRPGQGTANMQMAEYNLKYAKQLDGVKDKVADISSVDGLSDDKLNEILALVTPDKYNFGSGPWFLKTQCPSDVQSKLDQDIDTGFQAYMECVGVTVDDSRQAYFDRAKSAFGLK